MSLSITSKSRGLNFHLFLNCFSISSKLSAKRVRIYAPYVIVNQTGIPFQFKSSTALIGSDQIAASQSIETVKKYVFEFMC